MMGIVDNVTEFWDLIQTLQDLLPEASSNVVKDELESMLVKIVVKRIITAAASAVIPGIGWAVAIINLGLATYDLYQLNDELRELVELARVYVDGYIYDPETKPMKVAQRYGGKNDNSWISLISINDSDPSSKDGQKFFLAYADVSNHEVLVGNVEIIEQHALSIMSISSTDKIPEGDGLSVYTVNKNDAKRIAQGATGSSNYPDTDNRFHHTTLHQNADSGLKHYHHALHDGEKYPAHSFYGDRMTA